MSVKCKHDYWKVFKAIKKLLNSINVQALTLDFEAAI